MAFDANKLREIRERRDAEYAMQQASEAPKEESTTWVEDRKAELQTEIEDGTPQETYAFDPEESRANFEGVGTLVSNTFQDIARAETDYVMAEQGGDEEEIERARVNALRAPFKEATRQFTAAYADDNSSMFQGLAQVLRRSSANIEYFMTDDEKLETARKIHEKLPMIPGGAMLANTETMQNAMFAYDYTNKIQAAGGSMEQVYKDLPILKTIAGQDPLGAALALKDLKPIKESKNAIDAFFYGWKHGDANYEYGLLKMKEAFEGLTDDERDEVEKLEKTLKQTEQYIPSFWENPFVAMAGGGAESLPKMVYSFAKSIPYGVTGAVLGAALAGSPTFGAGLPAGAATGWTWGRRAGMTYEMFRPMMGRKFAEYQAMTDETGAPLMTRSQAQELATIETIPEALIEMGGAEVFLENLSGSGYAKKAIKEIIESGNAGITAKTAKQFAAAMGKELSVGTAKETVSESVEEFLQEYPSALMEEYINKGKGSNLFENGVPYDSEAVEGIRKQRAKNMDFSLSRFVDIASGAEWGDITKKAIMQGFEAAPGALFLGGLSAVGGAPVGGVRYGLESLAWRRQWGAMAKEERTTVSGTIMLDQLQNTVHDSKLKDTAPDVQREIIRDELKDTPWKMAYIDVEMALKNEGGLEDVREAGKAAGMTDEAIAQAIEQARETGNDTEGGPKSTIAVPLECYAQSAASQNLLDSVSFSQDADSMARMRENAKKAEAEYTRRMASEINKQIDLTEAMTKELFPEEGEERDAAMMAIYQDPENPAQGWKELYDKAVADRDEILAPALAALERGMGQGTSVIETVNDIGEVSTGRVSNNEEWYSKFYAEHKRQPNKEEKREMARKMMLGEPDAPQVQGWTVSDKETAEMMANEKDRLAAADHEIEVLEGIKERMQELNGAEMQLTAGMTPEAYKVYRTITTDLLKFGGKVGRAARVSALLWARHADVFAQRMRKLGNKDYTAMNWLNDTIKGIEEGRNAGIEYNQTAGNLADQKLEKDIENWKKEVNDIASFPDQKGEEKRRMPVVCSSLPLVYSLVNKEVGIDDVNIDKPVVISKGHFYDILHVKETNNTHGHKDEMEQAIINNLPKLLANPVGIMRNFDKEGNVIPGEVIAILEARDKEGNVIIAPVSLKEEAGAYRLKTFFGKNADIKFEQRFFYTDNFLYAANKKRFSAAMAQLSKKHSLGIKPTYGDTFYSNIPSEKDLVNLRNQNVGYYQFAGENAKTADTVKLEEAQRMEASGASAEDIYKATGWLKGEDGKWRFEIPDNLDKINLDLLRIREHLPLGELYENEDLFEAYPFLRDVIVSEEDMPEGSIGRLDVANNIIFLNADMLAAGDGKLKESIVHEIQHIIQFHEGFAMGGNPADVRGQILSAIRRIKGNVDQNKDAQEKYIAYQEKTLEALNDPTPEKWEEMQLAAEAFAKTVEPKNRKRFERLMSRMESLQKEYDSEHDNYFLYARLGGEQEARKTADRAEAWTKKNREAEKASRALNEGMEKATKEQRDALVKRMELAFEIDGQPTDQQIALMEKYESEMGEELSTLYDDYMWEHGELKEFEKDMPRPHNKAIIVFNGTELPYNKEFANAQTAKILDVLNQSAWHGSPHSFNSFDLGAIGTGEGAQVHGWGLYFAQNPEVAKRYRENLLANKSISYRISSNGELVSDEVKSILERYSLSYLYQASKVGQNQVKSDIEDFIKTLRGQQERGLEVYTRNLVKILENEIKRIDENPKMSISAFIKSIEDSTEKSRLKTIVESARRTAKEEGHRATIQDVKRRLEQHIEPFLRNIKRDEADADVLESLDLDNLKIEEESGSLFEVEIPDEDVMLDEQKTFEEQPEKVKKALETYAKKIDDKYFLARMVDDSFTGKKIYETIVSTTGSYRAASELLNQYGIKGITYDGRRDGRCYVVFDDNAISIIDSYNQEMNGRDIQGRTVNYSDGKRLVELFESADESTFLHESGHIFLMDLEKLAAMGDEESIADLKAVDDWASWHEGDAAKYKNTPWSKEFADRERYIKEAQKNGVAKMPDGTTKTEEQLLREWKQERFARGFEIYLKEGKAPSKGLKLVFEQFMKFLTQIYHAFSSDGARASSDVEAVMERLIATEEEIAATETDSRYEDFLKAGGEQLFDEDAQETFARWEEEAKQEARETLRKRVMRDLTKAAKEKREAMLKAERERKEEELSNQPVYLARRAIQGSKDKGAWIVAFPTKEAWEKADAAAPSMKDALDAYMQDFERSLDKKQITDALTEEAVEKAMSSAENHVRLLRMEQRAFQAKAAAVNRLNGKARTTMEGVKAQLDAMPEGAALDDSFARAVNSLKFSTRWSPEELSAIDKLAKSETKEDALKNLGEVRRLTQERKVGLADLREATKGKTAMLRKLAKAEIERQPIMQATQVQTHRKAEKDAAEAAKRAAKKGDWMAAAAAKEREMLAAFMAAEAEKTRNRVQSLLKKVKQQLGSKTKLPKDERYWHAHIAYLLRIADEDAAKPEGLEDISSIARSLGDGLDVATDENGRSNILDLMLKLTDGDTYKNGYHGMTLEQFEDATDVLQVLYTTGKDKFNMKTTQGKTVREVVEEICDDPTAYNGAKVTRSTITGHPNRGGVFWNDVLASIPKGGDAIATYAQRYALSLTKPEELIKLLGKKAHKYLYGLYDRAAEQEAGMTADFVGKIDSILAKYYTPAERREWQTRAYTFKGQSVSKENILAMALNLGNDVNMDRLVNGLESTAGEVQVFISQHMTEKDWLFCQDVWDLLAVYWPETVKVEMELNGTRLKPQTARAFNVRTKDAEGHEKDLSLRGGYYPIKYDPELSTKAGEQNENMKVQEAMTGATVLGMGRGFTKDRAAIGAVKRPLLLSLSVIPNHANEVIHNITTRIAARDVYRLLNDSQMKEYIEGTLGKDAYGVLTEWALDVWKVKPKEADMAESLVSKIRQNSGIAIMGYRMWPTIENATNIFPMMDALGAKETLSAMSDYYGNKKEFDELIAKSMFMKERTERMDRDMKRMGKMFVEKHPIPKWLVEHAYDPITYTDLLTSRPLWARAYKNAFSEKLAEVQQENDENTAAFEKRRAEYDEIAAQIHDMKVRRRDIRDELRRRQYRQLPLQETEFTRMSTAELRDESAMIDRDIEEKGKELFVASEKMQRASTLLIRTDKEMLDEAEHRSILAADKAVREVIGSGDTKDLSRVQRSRSEMMKAFTMFYSYFNTQANAIIGAHWKGKWQGGAEYDFMPVAKALAYRFLLTSALATVMRWVCLGEGSDDKDKYKKDKDGNKVEVPFMERAMKQYAKNALSTAIGGAYGLRDIGNYFINLAIDGRSYNARFDGMIGSLADKITKEAQLIMAKGERDEKAREAEAKRQERYRHMTPAQRKKFREEEKYRNPPNTISYADILRGAGTIATSLTAGTTGITEPIANAVLGTMQYIFDSDGRYDATLRNMMWSAFWMKKPVKRTAPEKPKKNEKKGR